MYRKYNIIGKQGGSMVNLLSVKNLSSNDLFTNLSFNIVEKSFNILIGKNGVGKTTLVYSILDLVPYKGKINFKYKKSDIGCISDFSDMIPENVYDYLAAPLLNLNYSDDKARKIVYSISKKFGISNLLSKNSDELHDEEKLLVLLCHSVIHEPKLVIIDNTLDELKESNKVKFINYLLKLKTTVIFVTNDSRYFKYANKLLVMTKSKMEEIKESAPINKLEQALVKNNSELPFSLDLSNKLYSYGMIKELYNSNSELVNNLWK